MGQYKNEKRIFSILTNLVSTFALLYISQYLGNICNDISLLVFVAVSKHQRSTSRKYKDSKSLDKSTKESKFLCYSKSLVHGYIDKRFYV